MQVKPNSFLWENITEQVGAKSYNIPYLNLDSLHGGLTPTEKGGGAQTVSLKFKSADGQVFAFRSVVKNPNKKLDRELRKTLYGDVMDLQSLLQTEKSPYELFNEV